jgi:hypothetical protein
MAIQAATAASVSAYTELSEFADEIFAYLPRTDQRRWARAYLAGLLTTPGRKTIQRIADLLPDVCGSNASNGLRQFVNFSPWEWQPARQTLLRLAAASMPLRVWTSVPVTIPKRGCHSVGVHRRFVPAAGRSLNGQFAHALLVASDQQAISVDWQLVLDRSWLSDQQRRRRARIPDDLGPRPDGSHLLSFARHIEACPGLGRLPLVADLSEHHDAGPAVAALARQDIPAVLRVRPEQPLTAVGSRDGQRWSAPARQLLDSAYARRLTCAGVPDGRERQRPVSVRSAFVRLPGTTPRGQADRTYVLLTFGRAAGGSPHAFWLASLVDQDAEAILAVVRSAGRARRLIRLLESCFGAADFEGRSFPGWHHHMTLVSAAHSYSALRQNAPVGFPADGLHAAPR